MRSLTPTAVLGAWMLFSSAGQAADDRFAILPANLQPFVDEGEISGAVMLVATKDRVLHSSAVGKAISRPAAP